MTNSRMKLTVDRHPATPPLSHNVWKLDNITILPPSYFKTRTLRALNGVQLQLSLVLHLNNIKSFKTTIPPMKNINDFQLFAPSANDQKAPDECAEPWGMIQCASLPSDLSVHFLRKRKGVAVMSKLYPSTPESWYSYLLLKWFCFSRGHHEIWIWPHFEPS